MELGLTVYTPVVDIEGIDCITHNDRGRLIKIQIKTRNLNDKEHKSFCVNKFKADYDFFICCYLIDKDQLWVIPSLNYDKIAGTNHKGQRVLILNDNGSQQLSQIPDKMTKEV